MGGWLYVISFMASSFVFFTYALYTIRPDPASIGWSLGIWFSALIIFCVLNVYWMLKTLRDYPMGLRVFKDRFEVQYSDRKEEILFNNVDSIEVTVRLFHMRLRRSGESLKFLSFITPWVELAFRARTLNCKYMIWRDQPYAESVNRLGDFLIETFPEEKLVDKSFGYPVK